MITANETKQIELNAYELVLVYNILSARTDTLREHIETEDYTRHVNGLGDYVKRADERYLSELMQVVDRIDLALNELRDGE